jgi:hypothetical protein
MSHKKNIGNDVPCTDSCDEVSTSAFALPHEAAEYSRRAFLRDGVSLVAGVSVGSLLGGTFARAQSESYTPQRKLIWINMSGGWDILEVTDPKMSSTSGIDMSYSWGEANLLAGSGTSERVGRWIPRMAAIGSDMVIVRGIAMGTTSHMAGSVYMDTGILSNAGRVNAASIPAIVASESVATIPIIQLNGGSDPQIDRGLLKPVSVVRAGNLDLYRSMYPTASDQVARRIAMLDYLKASLTKFGEQTGTSDRLSALSAAEEKIRAQFNAGVGSRLQLVDADRAPFQANAPMGMNRGMADAFALTLKLINNDLVTCVNLGIGGFDTHAGQAARLQPILTNVDHFISTLVEQLRTSGKLDSTLIVLYSDFGRTPKINNSNGRDHWPVGGAIMIGGGIEGGRVVGGTDDNMLALSANAQSGAVDSSGVQVAPTHLGGAVLELTLGSAYSQYRPYLESLPALTRLKAG